MKLILAVFLALVCTVITKGQDFKTVKTAQDVIDNYISANGGEDALRDVKSIEMNGSMNLMGTDAPIKVYVSDEYFYLSIDNPALGITQAVDIKKGRGWSKFGTMVKDVTPEDAKKYQKNAEELMWGYYLEPKKLGITYELMQNEAVNGKDAYVVDFKSAGEVMQTVYFDTKSFMRVKQLKNKTTSEYSDFREVDDSGVFMSYAINTSQGDVKVTEYKFNSKLKKSLTKKPQGTDN